MREKTGDRVNKIEQRVWDLAEPVTEALGCELWDVEYCKEAGRWFLRIYIDKDGGVNIADCEAVSRAMDEILDREDPVPESYVFEVSSAGAERELKRERDFQKFLGAHVELRLYKPVEGQKIFTGQLTAYDNGAVTMETAGVSHRFEKNQIALVRLRIV